MNTSKCVYWNFKLRDGIGDWAEDGCELVSADSEGIICHCYHLTNFAVLVVSIATKLTDLTNKFKSTINNNKYYLCTLY